MTPELEKLRNENAQAYKGASGPVGYKNGFNSAVKHCQEEISRLQAQLRAELMEGQEPSDRAQEANHYNWLDDRNAELEQTIRERDHTIMNLEYEVEETKSENTELRALIEEMQKWLHELCDYQFAIHDRTAASVRKSVQVHCSDVINSVSDRLAKMGVKYE